MEGSMEGDRMLIAIFGNLVLCGLLWIKFIFFCKKVPCFKSIERYNYIQNAKVSFFA